MVMDMDMDIDMDMDMGRVRAGLVVVLGLGVLCGLGLGDHDAGWPSLPMPHPLRIVAGDTLSIQFPARVRPVLLSETSCTACPYA